MLDSSEVEEDIVAFKYPTKSSSHLGEAPYLVHFLYTTGNSVRDDNCAHYLPSCWD